MPDQSVDRARTNSPPGIAASEWLALAIAAITIACILARPGWINHDCAQFLQTGQRVLMGEVPCVDLCDVNSPLVLYIHAIPAAIAQGLGTPAILTFTFGVLLLFFASALLIRHLLLSSTLGFTRNGVGALIAAALAVCLMSMGTEFGQRDHMLAPLVAPFLILRGLRWMDGTPAGKYRLAGPLIGVVAAIGICFKPYHILVILLSEAYWILSRRRLRPLLSGEMIALAATGVAYLIWLRWLLPLPIREAFWGELMPMILSGYKAYCVPFVVSASRRTVWVAVAGLLALLVFPPRPGPVRSLATALGLATVASLAAYFIQSKGWLYHALPALFWSALTGALVYADLAESRRPVRYLLLLFGAVVVLSRLITPYGEFHFAGQAAATVERYTRPGDRVLVLSTSVGDPPYPTLLRLNRFQATRYLCAWPVPGFYHGVSARPDGSFPYNTPDTASEHERRFLAHTAEDIRRFRPPLILIHSGGRQQALPPGFDMFQYMRHAGILGSAMQEYRRREPIPGFEVLTLASGDAGTP